MLRTRHGAPQPLTPSAAYGPPLEKNPVRAAGTMREIYNTQLVTTTVDSYNNAVSIFGQTSKHMSGA